MAKLLHDMRTDHIMLASIKTNVLKNRKDIFTTTDLPPGVRPGVTYPSPEKLQKGRAFGPFVSAAAALTALPVKARTCFAARFSPIAKQYGYNTASQRKKVGTVFTRTKHFI